MGRLYVSAWNNGLWVFDVSQVSTSIPTFLGSVSGGSTHSAWATDDGKFVVTGEERPGGGIKVYEIIEGVGAVTFRMTDRLSLGCAFSVHNQFFVGNRLYNSWYGCGLQVFDLTTDGQLRFAGSRIS